MEKKKTTLPCPNPSAFFLSGAGASGGVGARAQALEEEEAGEDEEEAGSCRRSCIARQSLVYVCEMICHFGF